MGFIPARAEPNRPRCQRKYSPPAQALRLPKSGQTTPSITTSDDAPASWLTLRIAAGGLTLNSNASLSGHVVAPNGAVTLNSANLEGSVTADQLVVNSNATLADPVD